MILAIDVGNTNIVIGAMDEKKLYFTARIATDRVKTCDDYAVNLKSILEIHGGGLPRVNGSILSTVVPALATVLQEAVERVTGHRPILVSSGMKTGINIRMDHPKQIGSDLIVDAVAAVAEYPAPMLIFDMGTATTVTAINEKGDYIGGMILAGAEISLEALASRTAQLPHIGMDAPARMLEKNTVSCMKSGFIYGNAAMIDGIIDRAEEEMGTRLTVVATGGIAKSVVPYCKRNVLLDSNLTLKGLWLLYQKNC